MADGTDKDKEVKPGEAPEKAPEKAEAEAPAKKAPEKAEAEAPAKKAPEKAEAEAPAEKAPEKAEAEAPAAADEKVGLGLEEAAAPARKSRGKSSRQVPAGIAHIKSTFNNTMVSITDPRGGVVAWSTAGRAGFKGSRKSTAFAATLVGQDAARQAIACGMHEVEVHVQGAGSGRESAIRALQSSGLNITVIKDVTPIPHNGCRPRKRRRV